MIVFGGFFFFWVLIDRNLTYDGEATQENPHKKKKHITLWFIIPLW